MEVMFAVLVVAALVLVGPVLAVVALVRAEGYGRRLRDLEDQIRTAEARLAALGRRMAGGAATAPAGPEPPPAGAPTAPEPEVVPPEMVRAPAPPPPAAVPPLRPPATAAPRPLPPPVPWPPVAAPPSRPPQAATDFISNLGPRLLAIGAALAFVVFLGFLVRYAWERNIIGPHGRVLLGAVTGAALVAGGVRMLRGRYRPLGQALAGAGLAGLYLSAFGAHGFYDLIPRWLAAGLMIVITACGVLLAERLDARLLASLAWTGGYLTPVLLSTGEDKAVALFAYLALLDLGALWLDHRKPWAETAPLAAAGTVFLYSGWYARFFSPGRFAVAALGVVLFTALFAFGMARKQRGAGMSAVLLLSAIGLSVLAGGADQPAWLLLLSLMLGGTALAFVHEMGTGLALVALGAVGMPLTVWGLSHYRPEAFGIAAAWVVGGLLMFLLARPLEREVSPRNAAGPMVGLPVTAAAVAGIAIAGRTDQPVGLMVFLLALAGIAVVARTRWPWSELVGVAGAGLGAAAWAEAFFGPERGGDAFLIALPVAGAYLLSLIVRGVVRRQSLVTADVLAHVAAATVAWMTLFHVLYETAPTRLGLASVALAVLYLALGLSARGHRTDDRLQIRTWLGLAAVFLTLAIPVQLGLHGITLAWAVEGALLLALGLRFDSWLTRMGAYLVLALSVLRLFARHLPLHEGDFTPVLNASFGTWLAVVVAMAVAALLVRKATAVEPADRVAGGFLAVGALILLFGLLSGEVADRFELMEQAARRAGEAAALEQARLLRRLSLSVLWTVFATGLLAGGLGLRSRPLYYSAYGLFLVTALKVVLVDLATLHTIYRLMSFGAMAVLLGAGAYLNLRFRERLVPREAEP